MKLGVLCGSLRLCAENSHRKDAKCRKAEKDRESGDRVMELLSKMNVRDISKKSSCKNLQVLFIVTFVLWRNNSMMFKGQNTRSMTRIAAWRSRASFGLACPNTPSLGVITLSYVNTIGTGSAEHQFSDCSQRER